MRAAAPCRVGTAHHYDSINGAVAGDARSTDLVNRAKQVARMQRERNPGDTSAPCRPAPDFISSGLRLLALFVAHLAPITLSGSLAPTNMLEKRRALAQVPKRGPLPILQLTRDRALP